MADDLLGIGKLTDNGVELFKTVYPDLLKPASEQVGKALGTVLGLGNTILLPIKLLNEGARMRYEKWMKEYEEKLNAVPEENITSVLPDIGLPIIDRLTYLTNEEIADLFINFLVSASLTTTINKAHPRFINILNSISVDEARLIKYLFENKTLFIPYIDYEINVFREEDNNNDDPVVSIRIAQDITNLRNEITFIDDTSVKLYLSNLESLGLIKRHVNERMQENVSVYKQIQKRTVEKAKSRRDEMVIELEKEYTNHRFPVKMIQSYYSLTNLGKTFIAICNKQ